MQQGSGLDRQQLILVLHAKKRGQLRGIRLHTPDMPVRVPVLCVHGTRERFDRLEIKFVQFLDVFLRLIVLLDVEMVELIQHHRDGSG